MKYRISIMAAACLLSVGGANAQTTVGNVTLGTGASQTGTTGIVVGNGSTITATTGPAGNAPDVVEMELAPVARRFSMVPQDK